MAAAQDPPLDEIQWKSPPLAATMLGIHSNSILFYFSHSPFFDPTSNNAVLVNQAMFNPNMHLVLASRETFEGRLRTMAGLEFMVAQEPAEMAPGTGTGVWVIRKQMRRKRLGVEDEVTVLATYFVVGDNIYMAPSVADVLASRTLSAITALKKSFETSTNLPIFTPSLGSLYNPPQRASRTKGTEAFDQLTQNSPTSTIPPTTEKSLSLSSMTSLPPPPISTSTLTHRLLEESFNISIKYDDEYMDENPVTGQPGDFHLSTTGRKEKEKPLPAQVTAAAKGSVTATTGKAPLGITVPPLRTDIPPTRKGSKSEKSPRSGAPKPKRRKSKGVISGGGISPGGVVSPK